MLFRKNNLFITTLLILGLATAAVGCKGKTAQKKGEETAAVAKQSADLVRGLPEGQKDSDVLPVADSYVKGKADAPITIVEFSDFQCPFCSRGNNTLTELMKKYPDKIRVVFKHYPLPFHQQAPAASFAALAAGEQGKFWEMHDKLFSLQGELRNHGSDMKAWTSGFAKEMGLDTAKYEADYDKIAAADPIKADMSLGSKVGVSGTPAFFINGKSLVGAQPLDKFEEVVKAELEAIEKLDGVKPEELYAARVKSNFAAPEPPKPAVPAQVIEMVPVLAEDPVKGNTKDPLVTIVEFSDFECPFCSRVNPTLDQVGKEYGDKVRVVFKQNPLSFHKNAEPAARAALAAGKQGKFWEMHDKLFQDQKALGDSSTYEKYAKELGLNLNKFKKDFDSDELKNKVAEDVKLADKVKARGTPNFFINGVQLVGAVPFPAFKAAIDKQVEVAEKLAKEKNLSGDALYEEVVKFNKANAPAPEAPARPEPKVVDTAILEVGKSFTKGPKNAPITIFEFSDFQCPFCSRGNNTLNDVLKEYDGKVQIVFKNFPLGFHHQAEPAARAALAAGQQGKFWEMHDKLFNAQANLTKPGIFQEFAKELGLNMSKFDKDFESDALKQQVKDDMALGGKVGVNGTPAFFVNGVMISGAQPLSKFKEVIDSQLKK